MKIEYNYNSVNIKMCYKISIIVFFMFSFNCANGETWENLKMPILTIESVSISDNLRNDTTVFPIQKQSLSEKFIYAQFVFHTSSKIPDGERWINSYSVSKETWDLIKKCKSDIEALDIMGNLGWELVCVTIREYKDYSYTVNTNYYFKKKIESNK